MNYTYPDKDATGLTIRQYFAVIAMQGLLSNSTYAKMLMEKVKMEDQADFLSAVSVEQADSLINELNKATL